MKWLYKYPQAAFPYAQTSSRRTAGGTARSPSTSCSTPACSTGDRYFDVVVEYAKATADDLLIRITATNRGPEAAPLHLLPTLWFRNTWSWDAGAPRPRLRVARLPGRAGT